MISLKYSIDYLCVTKGLVDRFFFGTGSAFEPVYWNWFHFRTGLFKSVFI